MAPSENLVGVLDADDLVVLHEVDVIGLEALETIRRVVWPRILWCGRRSWSCKKDLVAVTVAQGLAHAFLAAAIVVDPSNYP